VNNSTLPAYPAGLTDGLGHVEKLSTAFASFGKSVRASIEDATEVRDADSADLFTEISRDVDKSLWFLEAHVQK
jgi:starvation-inducible DNA-binding protein